MILFIIIVAFCSNADCIDNCNLNASLCEKHNYYNRFTIPADYNRHHSPSDIVDLKIGLFWNQLLYVDTAREAFSFSFILHLKWTDKRLTWPTEEQRLEITTVDSSLIWRPKLRSWFARDIDFAFEGTGRGVKGAGHARSFDCVASDNKYASRANSLL